MSVDFLDSNVILYLFDSKSGPKQRVSEELVHAGLSQGTACISFQVVQETLNVATTRAEPAMSPHDVQRLMQQILVPLWEVMPTAALYGRALVIQDRYRFGFYDSLIIAAALHAGCRRLYTEDLQDGQRIEGLVITNPFK